MDSRENNIRLTSAELSTLWATYMNDSMAIQVIAYFLNHITDKKIKEVMEFSYSLSKQHIEAITLVFNQEKCPIPYGFSKEDVNLSAPQLFTDSFYLIYLYFMGKAGMDAYSMALSNATRSDVRKLFKNFWIESSELMNKTAELLLNRGQFTRPPYMPMPSKAEYVQKKKYLNGWVGGRRPLNSIEITHVFGNLKTNEIGKSLITGFAQVAKSPQIRDFFIKGKKIAGKHVNVFSAILKKSDLPASMTADAVVIPSKSSPFSDKLMMYHISGMISIGMAKYGLAMSVSMRNDLALRYSKLFLEVAAYADEGIKIMIENGWLEQPPQMPDYENIAFQDK